MKNNNTFVVVNTKGGVGKTTISTMVLPVLFRDTNKKINIYEIDDNNNTQLRTNFLNFESLKIKDSEDRFGEVSFDLDIDENVVNIIDAGGGQDTIAVIKQIENINLKGATYIVPVDQGIEQPEYVQKNIELIKKVDDKATIFILFNYCVSYDFNEIKEQFSSFFDNISKKEKSIYEKLREQNISFIYLEDDIIFRTLKDSMKTTLFDQYKIGKNIVENITQLKIEWAKEGKETYIKRLKSYTFYKQCLSIITGIDKNIKDKIFEKKEEEQKDE